MMGPINWISKGPFGAPTKVGVKKYWMRDLVRDDWVFFLDAGSHPA